MVPARQVAGLLRHPLPFFRERLAEDPNPGTLVRTVVLPLAALTAAAVFARSVFAGSLVAGVVMAVGNLALQIGVWLGLALVLPALSRQFGAKVADRSGFVVATYSLVPLWLAGVLMIVPNDSGIFFWWSRGLVLLVGSWGLSLLWHGLEALTVERPVRPALLASVALVGLVIYSFLFLLLGIGANIVLFLLARTVG